MAIKFLNGIDVDGSMNLHSDDIPNLNASKVTSGTFSTSRIPNLSASKITSGTINASRLPDLSGTYQPVGNYLTSIPSEYLTQTEGDARYVNATGYNKSNWDTAYGWGNHASAGYLTSIPSTYATDAEVNNAVQAVNERIETEVLPSIPTNNNQLTNGAGYITDGNTGWNNSYGFITNSISTGITINGSLSRGTYTSASQYHTGADNIVLKGNGSGISGLFFESEKNGTNINHPSDFGFIQYHAYGTSTSGESNELIIGVSNDADDHVVLNAPNVNGLKFRVGSSATEYNVYHSGNLSLSTLGYTGATNANYITNNNQLTNGAGYATQSYVTTQINNVIDSAPGALNTLNELAAALGDDANFSTTVTNNIGAVNTRIDEEVFPALDTISTSIPTNNNQLTNGAGYITSADGGNAQTLDGINSTSFLRSDANDTMSGDLTLKYSTSNTDEYHALRFAPSSNDYIIKASSTRGAFGRKSFGWHIDTASAFGVYSNGWTKLFGVEGGTGNAFATGNFSAPSLTVSGSTNNGRIYADEWGVKVGTDSGYIQFGPANSTWAHIYTDRDAFYTNKPIYENNARLATQSYASSAADAVSIRIDNEILPIIPTNNNQLTNGAGYITSSSLPSSSQLVKVYNNVDYVVSGNANERGNYGQGVTVYEGYSGGANRPFTYDTTAQFMSTTSQGFEISIDWVSNTTTPMKVRHLRDCCQGWSPWINVWTEHNFTGTNISNWNTAYGWGNHASAGYTTNTGTITGVSTGAGLDGTASSGSVTISLDLSELTDMTAAVSPTVDEIILLDNGAERRKRFSEIFGSAAYQNTSAFETAGAADAAKEELIPLITTAQTTADDAATAAAAAQATADTAETRANTALANIPTNNNQLTNGAGYITGYTETSTLDSVADRGRTTNQQLISTNPSGFRVDSGSSARIEIDSNNSWSYVRLMDNGAVCWDIGTLDNGNLEWRPSGGDPNRMTLSKTGNLSVSGTIVASDDITAFSDARIKENVETLPNALESVKQMRGVTYNKIGEEKQSVGVIAQELEEVVPQLVHTDEEGMKSVAYGNLTAVLIEALKEQQAQIEELKARLDGLTK